MASVQRFRWVLERRRSAFGKTASIWVAESSFALKNRLFSSSPDKNACIAAFHDLYIYP